MNTMPRRSTLVKIGLAGLALVALVGIAAAQPVGTADRVLLLQAKRFEGAYKLSSGDTSLKVGDSTADWNVVSGSTSLSASLAPETGRPSRATLKVEGRTIEGKATIEGRTLSFDFTDGKTVYRIRLTLSGRNDGDLSVTKDDATLVSGAIRRV